MGEVIPFGKYGSKDGEDVGHMPTALLKTLLEDAEVIAGIAVVIQTVTSKTLVAYTPSRTGLQSDYAAALAEALTDGLQAEAGALDGTATD